MAELNLNSVSEQAVLAGVHQDLVGLTSKYNHTGQMVAAKMDESLFGFGFFSNLRIRLVATPWNDELLFWI